MLKNVVLPAPFGPMIETIDARRDAERDAVDGRRGRRRSSSGTASRGSRGPALRRSCSACASGVLMRAPPRPRRARPSRPSVNSAWWRFSGIRPCGRSTIMITSRKPKMPKPSCGQVEVQPDLARHVVEHVGDQARVDERQRDRADAPPPRSSPRPPRMIIASTKIENENSNWSALTVLEERAEERAGHAAARRADRVGEQLDLDGRDAHARRPRPRPRGSRSTPGRARVAQAEVDEQRRAARAPSAVQYHGRRFSVVNGSTNGRSILSTGLMPWRPLVRLKCRCRTRPRRR